MSWILGEHRRIGGQKGERNLALFSRGFGNEQASGAEGPTSVRTYRSLVRQLGNVPKGPSRCTWEHLNMSYSADASLLLGLKAPGTDTFI